MKHFFMKLAGYMPLKVRRKCYSIAGFNNVGNLSIAKKVWSDFPNNVYFSHEGHIGHGTEFHIGYGSANVFVGKNVWIAPNVHFYCVSHQLGESDKRAGNNIYNTISVGDGCWIGADSKILDGARIGPGTVIAAGSVVTSEIPANEMWGGVPAKFIKEI